jgi:tripartite-type tricarboxylate transporter receptor subunit TctC
MKRFLYCDGFMSRSGAITWFTAILLACTASLALAQAYPSKPVRIFVTIGPGAAGDILARIIGDELSKRMGQPFIIENRAGAGGNIAGEAVAKSAPDGYAFLLASSSTHGVNPSIYAKMPFDPIKDFVPVGLVAGNPNVLVVLPTLPVQSLKDLVELARQKPGELTFASGGSGTSMHMSGEMLNWLANVKMTHVPYKSTPQAVTAVLAGDVTMTYASVPVVIAQVKAGKLKALGVTSLKPLASWPDLPTLAGQGYPDLEASAWFGLAAPAGTPDAIVNRVNTELQQVLGTPSVRDRLQGQGMETLGGSPAEFGQFIRSEIERWSRVVKATGAKVN